MASTILAKVTGREITVEAYEPPSSGDVGTCSVRFEVAGLIADLPRKRVTFSTNTASVTVDYADEIPVPQECLAVRGSLWLTVTGYDTDEVQVARTHRMEYPISVSPAGEDEGASPSAPTLDVVSRIDALATRLEASEDSRDEAFTAGQKSREDAFASSQAERDASFAAAQSERGEAFIAAQKGREAAFETAQAENKVAFDSSQATNASEFEAAEKARESAFAGHMDAWGGEVDAAVSKADAAADAATEAASKAESAVGESSELKKAVDANAAALEGKLDKVNPEASGWFTMGTRADGDRGKNSVVMGVNCLASGDFAVAMGHTTKATGIASRAEGNQTIASGYCSHAEGNFTNVTKDGVTTKVYTTASGGNSHAEGSGTTASGSYSHSEGQTTVVSGNGSHAEGQDNVVAGSFSHSEGTNNTVLGSGTHVGGGYNTVPKGTNYSHVTGYGNEVDGSYSLTAGTYSSPNDVASGREVSNYKGTKNLANMKKHVAVVGNGKSKDSRSNAFALDWDGNAYHNGDVYANCAADSTGGKKLATEEYVVGAIDAKLGVIENGSY